MTPLTCGFVPHQSRLTLVCDAEGDHFDGADAFTRFRQGLVYALQNSPPNLQGVVLHPPGPMLPN
jgi:hypothetical protein